MVSPLADVQLLSFQSGWSWLTVHEDNVVHTSSSIIPTPVPSASVRWANAPFS